MNIGSRMEFSAEQWAGLKEHAESLWIVVPELAVLSRKPSKR